MNSVYADIEMVLARADLSEKASKEIFAILNDEKEKIPPYKALRLLRLLDSLKTGQFLNLVSKKKKFLQNFIELLKQHDMSVSWMCYLFFEQASPQKRPKHLLPEEMVTRLLMTAKMERVEGVKALIWNLLCRQGGQLARLITPEDLTFALLLDEPLTRNKLIMFMFRYFNVDKVIEAICKQHILKTGKRISRTISRQLIGLARAETELKHRSRLLSSIISRSNLTNEEIDRIWADYLKSRNRFELIKIFSSNSDTLGWIEDLKAGRGQLSFNFEPTKDISSMTGSFASRVHAIRKRLK